MLRLALLVFAVLVCPTLAFARTWTNPRNPPSAPGEALTSAATLPVKQASGGSPGTGRDAQSIVFFKSADSELLYSGEEIRNP